MKILSMATTLLSLFLLQLYCVEAESIDHKEEQLSPHLRRRNSVDSPSRNDVSFHDAILSSLSTTCGGGQTEAPRYMSLQEVDRSLVASRLSGLTYIMKEEENADPSVQLLQDGGGGGGSSSSSDYLESPDKVDAVYLTRHENKYCIAAFRGTKPFPFVDGKLSQDWLSNIDFAAVDISETCQVHRGYYQAYHNFTYRSQVQRFLDECQQECPSCDVVLTGHSQGGSIATIAALDVIQTTSINPYVITFGSPHGLGAGCLNLVQQLSGTCRWYHFVMAYSGIFGLTYDVVPMIYPQLFSRVATYAQQEGFGFVGHEFLLSMDDPRHMAYVGLDQHRFGMPYSAVAHLDSFYTNVLQSMWEAQQPTSLEGFVHGSLCNKNEECLSKTCRRSNFWDRKPQCDVPGAAIMEDAASATASQSMTIMTYEQEELEATIAAWEREKLHLDFEFPTLPP